MNVHTHWLGGLAAGAAVMSLVPAHAALVVLATAVFAAPLPDLDHPGSTPSCSEAHWGPAERS